MPGRFECGNCLLFFKHQEAQPLENTQSVLTSGCSLQSAACLTEPESPGTLETVSVPPWSWPSSSCAESSPEPFD